MDSQTLVFCLMVAFASADDPAPPPEVTVATGKLQGKWLQSRDGRKIAAFEGIPYAAAPVGQLRFQAPQPPQPWADVRMAVAPGPHCTQRSVTPQKTSIIGAEDCLFINVYTPEGTVHDKPLDVMLYIHGGAFSVGTGIMYQPDYLLDHDVVLATFNYRLGPLGFLSTMDGIIPGNAGLKDQVQAMRWVQQNIAAFGGNPNNVLIFGESAGAASVHFHTLSPLSTGLFHKGIAESGNVFCPWALAPPQQPCWYASLLAKHVDCPKGPSSALRDCLLDKSAPNITMSETILNEWNSQPISFFKPVVEIGGDGAFLTRHPREILKSGGPVNDVPFLTGVNSQEGCMWAVGVHINKSALKDFNEKFQLLIPVMLSIRYLPNQAVEDSVKQMREFYFGTGTITDEQKPNTIDFLTDALFLSHAILTVEMQVKYGKSAVYFYEFAHTSNRSYSTMMGSERADFGVCHGDELMYLFPVHKFTPLKGEISEDDVKISKQFIEYFVNFAATGQPTKDDFWKRVQHPEAAEYLRIFSPNDITLQSNYVPKRVDFWRQLPVTSAKETFQSNPGCRLD